MPIDARETDPEGIDYGWIMQVTFITTIVAGTPIVAIVSLFATLPTWSDRAVFTIRVGAFVWLVTLLGVYAYARRHHNADDSEDATDTPES